MSGDRAPRVLVSGVVLGQPMGGVVRHNAELLPRVAELLRAGGGALAVLEGRTPLRFDLPASVERFPSRVPWLPTAARALREGAALRRVLRDAARAGRPFDLVHVGHQPVPRRMGVPLTITVHDLRSVDLADGPRLRRALAPLVLASGLGRACLVFTVSEATRARLIERFGLDPARVRLVPNAADHFTPLPRDPATGDEAFLLHVGHVEPRKNLGLLLEALALDPTLPRLVLAGAAKAGEDVRLGARAEALGVAARVTLRPDLDDAELPGMLARAAAVVLPSRLEGFGIVALEALRGGAPLAVSDLPAHRETTRGHAAFFDPGDPRDCAAAIRSALATRPSLDPTGAPGWDDAARAWAAGWGDVARLPG